MPKTSVSAAETLTSDSAVDERKTFIQAYQTLLNLNAELFIVVDAKDLSNSLSTCCKAKDKSICADFSVIRFEFDTRKTNPMVWIPANQCQ